MMINQKLILRSRFRKTFGNYSILANWAERHQRSLKVESINQFTRMLNKHWLSHWFVVNHEKPIMHSALRWNMKKRFNWLQLVFMLSNGFTTLPYTALEIFYSSCSFSFCNIINSKTWRFMENGCCTSRREGEKKNSWDFRIPLRTSISYWILCADNFHWFSQKPKQHQQ